MSLLNFVSRSCSQISLIDSTCNLGFRLSGMNLNIIDKTKIIQNIFKTGQRNIEVGVIGNLQNTNKIIYSLKDDFYGDKILSGVSYSKSQAQELISCGGDEIIIPFSLNTFSTNNMSIYLKECESQIDLCNNKNIDTRALVYNGFQNNIPKLMNHVMTLKSMGISKFTLIEKEDTDPYELIDTLHSIKELVYLRDLSLCFISKQDDFKSLQRQYINCGTALDIGICNFVVSVNGLGGLVPSDGMVELLNERGYSHSISNMKPYTSLCEQIKKHM
jgi:hypothetical protein